MSNLKPIRGLLAVLLLAGCAHDGATPAAFASAVPRCADRALASDPLAAADADFGCATALNLRAMVADPRDLDEGRALAPAQGDAAIRGYDRYRAGQVKPLNGPTSARASAMNSGAD